MGSGLVSIEKDGMTSPAEGAPPILEVSNVEVVYNEVMLVLRGVSLVLPQGAVVAVLGSNGAGKTTLLRAITGLLDLHRGRVTKGSINLLGKSIVGRDAPSTVRAGLAQVMEGRRIFPALTVDENLRTGAYTRSSKAEVTASYDRVMELFPKLQKMRRNTAGYLSGGEQQMVAMGRALMANPKVLLLDEPSLGLAPLIVEEIFQVIGELRAEGRTILLVEQNAHMALKHADKFYLLERGQVTFEGTPGELEQDEVIRRAYLGSAKAG
jgi:branched-chain amino acid transport system ATP-binding protein